MRTTLSLDDDVAALLKRTVSKSNRRLKDIVNEALRIGLKPQRATPRPRTATRAWNGGRSLIGPIDSVSEALAIGEGEAFR